MGASGTSNIHGTSTTDTDAYPLTGPRKSENISNVSFNPLVIRPIQNSFYFFFLLFAFVVCSIFTYTTSRPLLNGLQIPCLPAVAVEKRLIVLNVDRYRAGTCHPAWLLSTLLNSGTPCIQFRDSVTTKVKLCRWSNSKVVYAAYIVVYSCICEAE